VPAAAGGLRLPAQPRPGPCWNLKGHGRNRYYPSQPEAAERSTSTGPSGAGAGTGASTSTSTGGPAGVHRRSAVHCSRETTLKPLLLCVCVPVAPPGVPEPAREGAVAGATAVRWSAQAV